MIEFIHKTLCKLNIHGWRAYYDPEYSKNGEMEYCEYCEAER